MSANNRPDSRWRCRFCNAIISINDDHVFAGLRRHLAQHQGVIATPVLGLTDSQILRRYTRVPTHEATQHVHVRCRGCGQEIDYLDAQGAIRYQAMRAHLHREHSLDADTFSNETVLAQFTIPDPMIPQSVTSLSFRCRCGETITCPVRDGAAVGDALARHLQQTHNLDVNTDGIPIEQWFSVLGDEAALRIQAAQPRENVVQRLNRIADQSISEAFLEGQLVNCSRCGTTHSAIDTMHYVGSNRICRTCAHELGVPFRELTNAQAEAEVRAERTTRQVTGERFNEQRNIYRDFIFIEPTHITHTRKPRKPKAEPAKVETGRNRVDEFFKNLQV